MKYFYTLIIILLIQPVYASTKDKCIDGNYSICRKILNEYGSSSNKIGATDFFYKVCSSDKLNIQCKIISSLKNETMKKTLELSTRISGGFVITGKLIDKIYLIQPTK